MIALAAFGWAVEPESGTEEVLKTSDQIEVNLVNIDVFVRDGKGNPVKDLELEDFVVRQDGEAREITNFTVLTEEIYRTAFETPMLPVLTPKEAPIEPPAEELPDLRPIWVALYVDSENLNPIHATRVLRRVRAFVDESLRPPIQMMVVANQAGLKVLQPFTDDPRAITGVLRGVAKYSGGWMDRESTRNAIITDMKDADADANSGNRQTSGDAGKRAMYQRIVGYAREESNNLSFSLSAIRQVIDTLAGIEGRKSIIYISDGLPMTPGLGLMHEYTSVFHDNSILSNHGRFNRQQQYQSITSAAASQDITFYTIDAQGLEVDLGGGADSAYEADPTSSRIGSSNFQGSMRYLAERTGGIAVVNTNDVKAGLQRVHEDFFTYYSIGFPVPTYGRDRVHRIEVEVVGRTGVDLRYRRRFVEKSIETEIRDQVSAGLLLGVSDNPMNVTVTRERAVPASGDYWTVPVTVAVPIDEITLLPAGEFRSGHIVLIVGTRDAEGRQSDVQRQEHEIQLPLGDDGQPSHWRVDVSFLMEAGLQRVVVGVLDQISHRDSYEMLNLSVP